MSETRQRKISLKGQKKSIVEAKKQLEILDGTLFADALFPKFSDKLSSQKELPLTVKNLRFFKSILATCAIKFASIVMLMQAQTGKK